MLKLSKGTKPYLYFQDIRRFGRFLVVPKGKYQSLPTLYSMGPEPLEKDFNDRQFAHALRRSSTAIKLIYLVKSL